VPLEPVAGPNAVPDKRPLPVGRGGGASFWRAGLAGGVGALECNGVTEFVEVVFIIGTELGLCGSESMSIGTGAGAAG
jgi:hypothetical protein